MRESTKAAIITFLVVCIMITSTALFVAQKANCDGRGGAWVKGAFWYECVERVP